MPLTETVTGPELRSPAEVRDAILLCGLVARSTGRVRTGIGSSRQDVNVSVRGGQRVEIKGVPKAGWPSSWSTTKPCASATCSGSATNCTAAGCERRTNPHGQLRRDRYFRRRRPGLHAAGDAGGRQGRRREDRGRTADLPKCRRSPIRCSSTSFRGRVRVIACLDEAPIVLSGAAMPEFPDKHEFSSGSGSGRSRARRTTFFIVFGPEDDCRTAAEEIRLRFADATRGVPQGDAAGADRRLHDLRADFARSRPHVPRHRLAADADYARAHGRGAEPAAAAALGTHRQVRCRCGCREETTQLPDPPRRGPDRRCRRRADRR